MLNLDIKAWIAEQPGLPDALKSLRQLITWLGIIINAARFLDLSHREAILPNETRWTGNFQTIRRFFQNDEYIRTTIEVENYLPIPVQRRCL